MSAFESHVGEYELGEYEGGEFEGEFEGGEFEGEYEGGEFEGEYEGGEFEGEFEGGEFEGEFEGGEFEGEFSHPELELEQFLGSILGSLVGEFESPLSGQQELELATELLEIGSEQELEQFLGKLFKRAGRAVGGFIRSPAGKALGGLLKNVAKKALPVVGGALGSFVAPGIGTAIGSKLGSMASGLFEVEFESMPAEAAEFEVARRFVNLGATAARQAAVARPPRGISPKVVARAALAGAARAQAPGVYRSMLRSLGAPASLIRRIPTGYRRPRVTRVPGRVSPIQRRGYPAGRQVSRARGASPAARRGYGASPRYRGYRGYGGYRGVRYPGYYGGDWSDGYAPADGYAVDGSAPVAARPIAVGGGQPYGASSGGLRRQNAGRWVRRGRYIIISGV